nr:fructose PTS transporter subunit IIB [Corynebacterium belfantii]
MAVPLDAKKNNAPSSPITIAAITACPTGIAHTYMAADALTSAAKARGDVSLLVKTQGASDNSVLSEKEIASADVVIFATDVGVRDRERFKGKRILECSPRQAIRDPNDTLSAAIALKNASTNTTVRPHVTRRVSATAYDLERKSATLR